MIRKKMTDIMAREATSVDLKDLVAKFIPEAIGKDIEKSCQGENQEYLGVHAWEQGNQFMGLRLRHVHPSIQMEMLNLFLWSMESLVVCCYALPGKEVIQHLHLMKTIDTILRMVVVA